MSREIKQTFAQVIPYGNGVYTNAQMVGNVIHTLCQVSVSGKENLDRLLGSILALESVQKSLIKQEKEAFNADDDNEQGAVVSDAVGE